MSRIHQLALVTATALSVVALSDAAYVGITGRTSPLSDAFGLTPIMVVTGLLHALTYAALVAVLVSTGERIDAGSRVRRWFRRLLAVDLAVLAAFFLVGTSFLPAIERAGGTGVSSAVGGIAFALMFVLAVALGTASVRRPEGRSAALVLIGTAPLIGLAAGLGALGSGFAHPAYPEATVYLGIALLAYQVSASSRSSSSALEPAAAR